MPRDTPLPKGKRRTHPRQAKALPLNDPSRHANAKHALKPQIKRLFTPRYITQVQVSRSRDVTKARIRNESAVTRDAFSLSY